LWDAAWHGVGLSYVLCHLISDGEFVHVLHVSLEYVGWHASGFEELFEEWPEYLIETLLYVSGAAREWAI
jgi:hypothetical protein